MKATAVVCHYYSGVKLLHSAFQHTFSHILVAVDHLILTCMLAAFPQHMQCGSSCVPAASTVGASACGSMSQIATWQHDCCCHAVCLFGAAADDECHAVLCRAPSPLITAPCVLLEPPVLWAWHCKHLSAFSDICCFVGVSAPCSLGLFLW